MKKRILALLGLTSVALAASVVSLSTKTSEKYNYVQEGMIDDNHYREAVYDNPDVKPVKMQLMDYNDYTQQPTGDNMYNTQKNYHLNSLNLGTLWDTYRGDGVTVCVIDTGVNYSHQDFVYYNQTGTSISDLSACFSDPNGTGTATKKTVKNDGWSIMTDENGHGTNVASTIASRINGTGCVGVAPNVNLMFCKAPNLMSSEVSAAIRYAADNGADIITMSLGMYATSFTSPYTGEPVTYSSSAPSLFSSAIDYAHGKGCIILASAGNDNTGEPSYPASNNYVIGVGALDKNSRSSKAAYSNFNRSSNTKNSNNNVDVTVVGSVYVATKASSSSYGSTQGTSFSCPITAATLALYCQSHPDWTEATATQALYNTCTDIGSTGWDSTYGYGCVDASALVNISYDLEDINLSKSSFSLYDNDDTTILSATTVPSYATANKINWSSSNTSIATVSKSQSNSGEEVTITGKGQGTATITATSATNPSISKTCTVEVEHYTDSSFSVDEEMSMVVGDQKQIEVTWDNPNPTSDDLMYSSSNTSVCTVSDSGLVKALKAGSSIITVESLDDIEEIAVTVSDEAPGDYNLVYNASDLTAGDRIVFVSESKNKVNGGLTSNYLSTVDVTIDITNHKITSLPTGAVPMVLGGSTGAWTFSLGGSTLLYGAAEALSITSGSNYSTASIAINSTNGNATIKFNNSYQLYHNDSATRFRTYKNLQGNVQIYKKDSGSGPTPTENYTVTFNSNGGSGTMTSKTTSGSSYVVPTCTFSKSGYAFSKWALNSTSGQQYSVGSTITGISDNITLYAIWVEGGSGAQLDPHYYDSITSDLSGTNLLSALRTLNLSKRTSTVGYSSMGTSSSGQFKYTDYDPTTVQYDNKGQPYGTKILSFYSGQSVTSFNREHVWPDSRGGNKVEADIFMPRPTIQAENSNRGNSSYVEGMVHSSNGWDPVTAFADNIGVYDNIRGECARIIFYCMTADSALTIKEGADTSYSNSIGSLSDLLKWNLNYPVNDREIRRQSGGQYLQGNRNAFVDDPGYACKIWGTYNSATKQICGITDRVLSSISLSGNYKTDFVVGESFSFGGTVTANYASGDPANVTSKATFTGYDLNTAGNQTVTVHYTENNVEKTATYQITVTAQEDLPDPTSISVSPTSTSVEIGSDVTISATVLPSGSNHLLTWTSSDSTIATVSNGVVTGVKAGRVTITAKTVNNLTAEATVTVTAPSTVKASIDFTHSNSTDTDDYGNTWTGSSGASGSYYRLDENGKIESSSIAIDTSKTISIKVSMGSYGGSGTLQCYAINSSGNKVTNTLSWSATDKGPKDVTGTLTFTAQDDENIKIIFARSAGQVRFYTADVTYSPYIGGPEVTDISVDPTSMNLDLYGTYSKTLTATVTADDGADTTVSWESSDPTVAIVSAETGNSITVTGLKVGDATITATAGEKTATCTVSVSDSTPRVTGISLDSTKTLDLYGDATGTLTPTVTKVGNPSYTISWSSSNTDIVEVDQSGNLTAKKTGSATITASVSSFSATCLVTVDDTTPIVREVTIDEETAPVNLDVYSNKTGTITLKINADAGAVYEVHWTSSNENVATVAPITRRSVAKAASIIEASAEITAVGSGTTTITAEAGGKEASYNLTIADSTPHVSGVTLNTTSTTLNIADTLQLNATVTPPEAINKNVTWSSNDESVASVTASGLVTANSAGTATITVTTEEGGYTATCSVTVRSSSDAAIAEAKAWAIYFINKTTTSSTCKASTDTQRLSGLKGVWSDLETRYGNLSNDAKTAFCTNSDEKIKEALNHYQFIISKFNKDSVELTDFVVDGKGNHPISSSRSLMSTMFSFENSGFIVAILSIIGVASISVFVVHKRRKTY